MNSDKEKAPTEICYAAEANQPTNGNEGESNNVTWGYGIASGGAVKWFKLLLLDDKDIGEEKHNSVQIRRARELLRRAGKTPVQAVADYLLFLWKHAIDSIEQELGESAVEGSPFRVVLTVPAVWTSKAVRRMRQAAIDAGILESRLAGETTLHFVSEPEAAALATFEDMKSRPNFQVVPRILNISIVPNRRFRRAILSSCVMREEELLYVALAKHLILLLRTALTHKHVGFDQL